MAKLKQVILCVDDEPNSLLVRTMVLEAAGYHVLAASSGKEALQALGSSEVDLVVSDQLMPTMTGTQLTRQLKSLRPEIPVVLISGVNEIPADAHLADLFMSKSEGPMAMCEKISTVLSGTARASRPRGPEGQAPAQTGEGTVLEGGPEQPAPGPDISGLLFQSQDCERRRIARELHDSAGQILTGLGLNLAVLRLLSPQEDSRIVAAIDESQRLVEQLTTEIRTMSYLLHPPLLDEGGLVEALRWYVQGLNERSTLKVELEIPPDFQRISPALELAIFRIVQEALTNVHRHSRCTSAAVRVAQDDFAVSVEIQDFGKSIPAEKLNNIQSYGSGVGIQGMRERVRQARGELKVESNDAGTTICARFPISDAACEPNPRASKMAIILCIDDEPNTTEARKLLLESQGHRVINAATGAEGIRRFQENRPDLVMVDYWMAGMNGLAVAREIKRLSPATPVIVLSGLSELPGEAVGIADRWIVKASPPQVLLDALADLL